MGLLFDQDGLDIPFDIDSHMHKITYPLRPDSLSTKANMGFKRDDEKVIVTTEKAGHGGGDKRLHEKIFKTSDVKDPYDRDAGVRDGAMSILIGIAARKSIESGRPIKVQELTDLVPRAKRLI